MSKKRAPVETPTIAPLPAECCLTCKFYLMPDGLCRRYPPQVIGAATGRKQPDGSPVFAWMSAFPGMGPSGLCGEWRARVMN